MILLKDHAWFWRDPETGCFVLECQVCGLIEPVSSEDVSWLAQICNRHNRERHG